jgi:tetratricopeptide (TPR) repeat protein
MYIRALKGTEKALSVEYISILGIVNNLGFFYVDQGKLDVIEEIYIRVLKEKEKALDIKYISILGTINNLGLLYVNQGKLDEVEEMYIRVLKGYEKALGVEYNIMDGVCFTDVPFLHVTYSTNFPQTYISTLQPIRYPNIFKMCAIDCLIKLFIFYWKLIILRRFR